MMLKSMLTAALAATLALPLAAQADPAQNYVKIAVGEARADFDNWGKETATAVSLAYGMPLTEMFDVEVGYINFGTARVRNTLGDTLNAKSESLFIAAIGKLPLATGFTAFGKLGASYHWNKWSGVVSGAPESNKDDRLAPMLGLGVSYQFTKELAADLEFTHFNTIAKDGNNEAHLDLLALGLRYTF